MEWEITVIDQAGQAVPVIVEATGAATAGHLRQQLIPMVGRAAPLHLGDRRLPDDAPLADCGLTTGATLQAGQTTLDLTDHPDPAGGKRELAVVGGRYGGTRVPLPTGETTLVGRGEDCRLRLPDPEVSRRHAEVRAGEASRTDDAGDTDKAGRSCNPGKASKAGKAGAAGAASETGVTIRDLGSRNGIGYRGHQLTGTAEAGTTEAGPDDVFQVGETLLAVRPVPTADGHLQTDTDGGGCWFNRPPRILPPDKVPEVAIPAEPERPRGFRFPLALVLLPLLAAAVLYLVLPHARYFLIFLALSPLMALAHYITERRNGGREHRERLRRYRRELATAQGRLAAIAAAEERTSRAALPDPAALLTIVAGPTGRLFERRPADPDFLRLRVGVADRPAQVRLTGPGAAGEAPRTGYALPVAVDLAEVGVVGLAGPRPVALPIVRAVTAHAATLHAPHDLGLVVLTGTDAAADWEWASWLPHTLPHRADLGCGRLFGCDAAQVEHRLAALHRLVEERREEQRSSLRGGTPIGRRLLVVVDGARRLRDLPGLVDLLAVGPTVGIYALCVDTGAAHLPDECRATVVVTSSSGTRVRVSQPDRPPAEEVLADGLPVRLADRLARRLAPVRVLGARFGADEGLPDTVRYLALAGLDRTGTGPGALDPAPIVRGWHGQPEGRSTRALLGVGASGPVEVDLSRDGPHALVAGTSGAGKSELLQTLIASLALANTPDALNLVLVDYKGGSAFAECQQLPHCVGMVTDLDGHLVNRALASLSAELRRREAILAAAGAKDVADYWARTGGRLPRLVIVVDEFASLVEEVPEFVPGVVGIGMRGRSLGVHVVLATQRPGGVVNAELRANLNLRIALRVTSTSESADVIDAPDAARISRHHPGRAYLRTGHSDLTTFQSARVGCPRSGLAAPDRPTSVEIRPRRMAELGRSVTGPTGGSSDGHAGPTDLTALVATVRAAADQLGVCAPASPWLPPLPEFVTVDQLPEPDHLNEPPATVGTAEPATPVSAAIGLADHPDRQAQLPYLLDLARAAPVAVAGMARSGRSTVLRTLAARLADRTSPADLHLYLLDYGSRSLAPLAGLPHCGAWVPADEPDRVERLLALLTEELGRRQHRLAAGGYGSLREQRAGTGPGEALPYLVLLLDQYETFLERHDDADGGRLIETVDGLLRRGPAVGILPVLTTDRSGFGSRIASAIPTRLVLRQADPDQLTSFGLQPREVPGRLPPGRAVLVPGAVEVQVALLDPDPDGAAQTAAVQRLAGALTARWDGLAEPLRPRRVDPLPERITRAELVTMRAGAAPASPTSVPIGAGGDHLAPIDVDLAGAGTLLIAGPPRSGRSTALLGIAAALRERAGAPALVAVCPRPSPLRELAGCPGVAAVLTGGDPDAALAAALQQANGPVAVLVDDAELLADSPAGDLLEQLARTARDHAHLVTAAGITEDLLAQRYRGWLARLRRNRHGVLLTPSSYLDGELFDLRLPRSTGVGWPPGRGLLVTHGTATPVQLPLPDPVPPGCAPAEVVRA